jgi:CelD/BcsL family acetyltransferase involved in cellulose biosynthesis
MLRVVEINTFDEFLALRREWNRILAKSRDNNIFLTWEYLSIFWKHFGKSSQLRVLCIRDEDEIIAIAPLRQFRYNFANLLGYEVIEPLGYRGLMPEGGDYTGLLLGEREEECLKLFLNYLFEHDNWDFVYLYDIPGISTIPNLLLTLSGSIPKFEMVKGTVCPYIPLPDSIDIFLKGLRRKFRKELRRCMRNLQKDYRRVELKRYNELSSVEETMNVLFKLNRKRWKSKHLPGTFKTKEICDFYIDVAKIFANRGWLALYFLTVNDEPVAGLYGFEYHRKMLAAVTGFNPSYSRYSIGNLLFLKVIEECIKRKLIEFDFMKGNEPYKFGWTAKYRRNVSVKFVNNNPASNFYNWGIKTLKRLKIDKIVGKNRCHISCY